MKRILGSLLAISALCTLSAFVSGAAHHEKGGGLEAGLSRQDRPAGDRDRDAGRKPKEVIAFLGIEPGMTVIDLIAAGGYYTEVLSAAVGPTGKVYAQNSDYVLKIRDGANDKAMTARLADGRLPNVERLDREMDDLGLAPGSVDAAITALNFHDVYNSRGEEAAVGFLKTVLRVLKPGGVLGIIDHHGRNTDDDIELHRIGEPVVIAAARAAGFEVDGTSELLRNPADDRTKNVFEPSVRGKTDRFLLRLRKPR
jgi:predicted methyltransferase